MSQHAFSECGFLCPPSLSSCSVCCALLFAAKFTRRYTLLKGLELSKAAAQGLNKVLGDKHDKSREAKDLYRDFLSKKQVLLPASPSADQCVRPSAATTSSPASSARALD
jgi:hypothetical protein